MEVRFRIKQKDPQDKANQLTYPELGNPLVNIVQTLFQSLSTAVTKSLLEPNFTPLPEPKVV